MSIVETVRSEVKNWWWFLIIGLLFIAAGIAIYARPIEGYVGLSVLFSVVMLSTGLSQIFFSLANSNVLRGWGWTLASGIIDVALGIYLLVYPLVTIATLPFFVGFWLIFRSFYLIGASIDLSSMRGSGWGWLLTGAILVLIFGCLIIYYPAAGVISIVALSGSAFIVGGFMNIYFGFQLKSLGKDVGQIKKAVGGEYKHG